MEQQYWLFLNLPLELSLEILTDAGNKAIASIASLNKPHLDLFKKPNGLFQRLVARICNKNIQGPIREDFDWYREFRIVSHYYDQILNNTVVDPRDLENLKSAYNIDETVKLAEEETDSQKAVLQQSKLPLYPLPIGDYSTAYYEIELDEDLGEEDLIAEVGIGACLQGSTLKPGLFHNSFGYCSSGFIFLENTFGWREEPFETPFYIDLGDIVGFGINFKKNSIFFTVNGELVYETNETAFGKPLLNLKALHAHYLVVLEKDENTAEEMKRVTPIVNFGADEFAFDLIKYQKSQSTDENDSPKKLRFYSDVIAKHVLTYPHYETIKAFEEDPKRIDHLIAMTRATDFPSNISTKLEHFLYGITFLRTAYHDLPDGDRLEEEFKDIRTHLSTLSLLINCDKAKANIANITIKSSKLDKIIAEEGHDTFFELRYAKISWEVCDQLLSLIKGHCWSIVFSAFVRQEEWALALLCYRVFTWQYLMEQDEEEMDPEHANAAKKLLVKILGIKEPEPTPEFVEFDTAFCHYCFSNLRWLAIKTLIKEREPLIRRQIIKKRAELMKLFGQSDPILKEWGTAIRPLLPKKTNEQTYDKPIQNLGLRLFSSKINQPDFQEKLDVSKINFTSEDERLQAQIFDFIRKEKIFGELKTDEEGSEDSDSKQEDNKE